MDFAGWLCYTGDVAKCEEGGIRKFMSLPGVYKTALKDGTVSYRASITSRKKHISLGSFPEEKRAAEAYALAALILSDSTEGILDYRSSCALSFEKWVSLINLRDNGIYFATPIYLMKTYFSYYLAPDLELKFDLEDLFYYASHKIMRRGGHLFVADYGMQVNLPSRYGIKNYAVQGKDFQFINGDPCDFRYENIKILNAYHGVTLSRKKGTVSYRARIHVRSYYVIGYYESAMEAAIAYNKAVDIVKKRYPAKNYELNYIPELRAAEYADLYDKIRISDAVYEI